MSTITYSRQNDIHKDDIAKLFLLVDCNFADDPETMKATILTGECVSAWCNGEVIGLISAVIANNLDAFTYLLVHPDYQDRDIENTLMAKGMMYYDNTNRRILVTNFRMEIYFSQFGFDLMSFPCATSEQRQRWIER